MIKTQHCPADVIAGRTITEWQDFARRDDCLDQMVPSDLRQIIAALQQSRSAVEALRPVVELFDDNPITERMFKPSDVANIRAALQEQSK